jgi:hypothetical protein
MTKDVWPDSGHTSLPLVLYHRNPLDCIQSLLDRPFLCESMEFAPRRTWEDSNWKSRVYSEIMTGNWAWQTQVRPPFTFYQEVCSIDSRIILGET